MACGGCGSGKSKPLRVQRLAKKEVNKKLPIVQNLRKNVVYAQGASTKHCIYCNYPLMIITIAGKERYQCTNTGCRRIA